MLIFSLGADPALSKALRECAEAREGGVGVREVVAIHQGPEMVIAVISADFEDTMPASRVEDIVADIERSISESYPVVTRVYVRPFDKGRALSPT